MTLGGNCDSKIVSGFESKMLFDRIDAENDKSETEKKTLAEKWPTRDRQKDHMTRHISPFICLKLKKRSNYLTRLEQTRSNNLTNYITFTFTQETSQKSCGWVKIKGIKF